MTMNRVQFQPGLSIAEFVDQFGSEYKCEAALIASRWPGGFFLLGVWLRAQQLVSPPGTAVLPVHGVLASVQRDQRHDLRGDQTAAVVLVPGHAPAHAIEEQCRRARTQAPSGCLLQNSLVHEAQAHGCHARARTRVNATGAWRSTTPISAARAPVARLEHGSENKVPFVAAMQTTPGGQPQLVCLRQQPFTR